MNIVINNYCNLKCEYCFANKVLKEKNENITINDMALALDFVENSNYNSIGILGGEPTLHPQFKDILSTIKSKTRINYVKFFSNGLFKEELIECFLKLSTYKKISFLINYNHPDIIGKNKNSLLLNNIKELNRNKLEVVLGINFYKCNQDYSYVIEASKELNLKSIRWSPVVPNSNSISKYSIVEYVNRIKNLLLNFLIECKKNDLSPIVDCNNIPMCLLNDSEFRYMVYLENNYISSCNPVIDILPDLSVIRCFALSDYKTKLTDFKTINEIREYFIENIDNRITKTLLEECKTCIAYKARNKSCGCLMYKMN